VSILLLGANRKGKKSEMAEKVRNGDRKNESWRKRK